MSEKSLFAPSLLLSVEPSLGNVFDLTPDNVKDIIPSLDGFLQCYQKEFTQFLRENGKWKKQKDFVFGGLELGSHYNTDAMLIMQELATGNEILDALRFSSRPKFQIENGLFFYYAQAYIGAFPFLNRYEKVIVPRSLFK